jgi:hypothetical protein
VTEFEIAVSWRYTPDPDDYRVSGWDQVSPEEALENDLENLRGNPGAYVPKDAQVTGRVVYRSSEDQMAVEWLPCGCLEDEVRNNGYHRKECEHQGARCGHRHGCCDFDCAKAAHADPGTFPLCWTEEDREKVYKTRKLVDRGRC